jgi:type I restriction enzyme M protein
MMKGADADRMVQGNSLTQDGWADKHFDYMLANPPYGVDWKGYAEPIKDEADRLGFNGRFGAGLPRVSDGSFLFLQHMLSKMKPVDDRPETAWVDGGSKIGIVLSGSPLFSGQAGSGESEIRRWIIENDWLECIVALPDQMFYNTGINTYVWIVTNRKPESRHGRVLLIDARSSGSRMRRPLGDKRKELTESAINQITASFSTGDASASGDALRVRIVDNDDLGFAKITIEQPLRLRWVVSASVLDGLDANERALITHLADVAFDDEVGAKRALTQAGLDARAASKILKSMATPDPSAPVHMKKGEAEPDPSLRDTDSIALPPGYVAADDAGRSAMLRNAAREYLTREVLPYAPEAWIDFERTRVGYEIPFNAFFHEYSAPRDPASIRDDIARINERIHMLLAGKVGS